MVERAGRFFGADLNLAARVAGQARGDQVLATASVAEAATKQRIAVAKLGPFTLRNIREPVELFALDLSGAMVADATDPVYRMRVWPERAPARLRHAGVDYWFCSLSCAASFAASPDSYVI